ncbi:MAG: hypothetical protein F6J93_36880 [Oscillatoria sp. SIO1A7]|nr:hypothetical protein [Oscillatoria sp. SIO1A7]
MGCSCAGKLHTISRPLSGAGKYGNSGFGFQLGTIPVVTVFCDNPERVNTLGVGCRETVGGWKVLQLGGFGMKSGDDTQLSSKRRNCPENQHPTPNPLSRVCFL